MTTFERLKTLRALGFTLAALFFISSSIYLYSRPPNRFYAAHYTESPVDPFRGRQIAFWKTFYDVLDRHTPDCPSPKRSKDAEPILFEDAVSCDEWPQLVEAPETHVKAMKQAHAQFVNETKHSEDLQPIHTPGTRGIVTRAGGAYFPLFLLQLRMLRRSGSKLPVEAFIKDADEYEPHLCEKVLPKYNAKCVVLSDLLNPKGKSESPQSDGAKYDRMFRTLAVIFSSFEDVLWMDADCFPLHNVDDFFTADPFKSKGLVIWPDLWVSTTSPLYFKISQQKEPSVMSRPSSDTSVLLISKRTHFLTSLLAAYYDYHGPSHYFTLLRQGALGDDDKEIFPLAASALGEPFYVVQTHPQLLRHDSDNATAIAQSDAIADFYKGKPRRYRNRRVGGNPRIAFIHSSFPKFDPRDGIYSYKWEVPLENPSRQWTSPPAVVKRFGYDAERTYWEEVKWAACHLRKTVKLLQEMRDVCKIARQHWDKVYGNFTGGKSASP
ncbi:hypothetical protein VTN49DRAFT_1135 [Thermomyces lanuginosus]|uniref:uncharacterized protein n=1 Tax=Thermomyces lanuginosus TaxID=5541 RepID=UPI0037438AD5